MAFEERFELLCEKAQTAIEGMNGKEKNTERSDNGIGRE